jgi:hypothetical protein
VSCTPAEPNAYAELRGRPDPTAPSHTRRYAEGKLWAHVHRSTGALRFCDGRHVEELPLADVLRALPPSALRAALAELDI